MVSGKSHSAEKCKKGPLGVFEHPSLCKIGKNEGGTFWRHLKNLRKKSHQAEKTCTKNFGHGRDSNLLLGRHQKLS